MSDVKKKLSKEEKMENARKLMAQIKDLELNPEELDRVAAGSLCGPGDLFPKLFGD